MDRVARSQRVLISYWKLPPSARGSPTGVFFGSQNAMSQTNDTLVTPCIGVIVSLAYNKRR
jgi:hypothetical protein